MGDVHAFRLGGIDFDVGAPVARTPDDPVVQELLRELRDILFVIAGAAEHMAHGSGDETDALVDGLVTVATRAADRARLLADYISAQSEGAAASREPQHGSQ